VKLEGTDDHDIYGVYIETPECCFWQDFEHFVTSTSPQTERNKADDVDVTCYSLQKFARLAAAGNPTVLHMLFTPVEPREVEWNALIQSRSLFLAKAHAVSTRVTLTHNFAAWRARAAGENMASAPNWKNDSAMM
jgi:predicted nucleotidyltransferase